MSSKHRSISEFVSDQWDKITGKNQPPWDENWVLDDKFFRQMEAWGAEHPESTFAKVIEKVDSAITMCQPFLGHIPDSPFPARSLIQGLAYLLQLGTTITSAKKDVYDFTLEVSSWFSAVDASLRGGKKRKFAGQATKNLTVIRNLINEICKWGWARVNDGRWASFVNGFTISGEIQAFKERLTEARALLSVMQDINIALALDDILSEILTIRRFTKCQLGQIMDYLKEKDLVEQRRRHLDETLNPKIALRETAYDDQGKLPCDADTRVEILANIATWVNDVSPKSQNFFWMTGDPGCGKSAIAASLARHRKDEECIPSIAYQMAKHSSNPTVSKTISEILKAKPSLLDGISNHQALKLFVDVMQVACDVAKNKPVVVVMDGLDETSRESLEDIAMIFSGLFKELQRPNAKVFISSRTDNEITKPFFRSLRSNEKHVKHVHLDTSDPSSMEDVSKFLSRRVGRLVEDENLNLEIWPGRERFERLCLRAAGLFIWAVTVVKFFKEQLRLHGPEYLNDLLDAITADGMNDVNKLYQTILAITYTPTATLPGNAWAHETFRWVVGFIIALKEPLSIGDVGALLELRRTSTSNPIDILRFATNLRTVLVAGTDEITKATIPRLHKSFVEFITSDKADKEFRIDLDVVDVEIALKCLHLVKRVGDGDNRSKIPPGSVRYAIQNWTRHLAKEGIASGVAVFGDNETFLRIITSTAVLSMRKSVMSVSGDYRTHMYDSGKGFPPPAPFHFIPSSTINVGDPGYAVVVSMDGQTIASGHCGGAVRIWDSKSHGLIGEPLQGHSRTVMSLCFSPDSRWLVPGSDDKSVRVWNCRTGQAAVSPRFGYTSHVNSVSTDGYLIISGSYDKTIRIWDFATGEPIGLPINTGNFVRAVALSNDGCIVAAVDDNVCVWDVKTRLRIASMTHSHVRTVAFSPDNSRIASGNMAQSIRLWDALSYTQIWESNGHMGWIYSVSFSPDGRWIASGSDDGTVRVWNSNTGQLIGPPLQSHTEAARSVAFSPDNRQVISGGLDTVIRIWSKSSHKEQITTIHLSQNTHSTTPFEGNTPVVAACYSPDYTLYSASTLDGHVSLWNVTHLVWEHVTPIHPIHLLKLSADRLIISSPDGSTCTWMGNPHVKHPPRLTCSSMRRISVNSECKAAHPPIIPSFDGCLSRQMLVHGPTLMAQHLNTSHKFLTNMPSVPRRKLPNLKIRYLHQDYQLMTTTLAETDFEERSSWEMPAKSFPIL